MVYTAAIRNGENTKITARRMATAVCSFFLESSIICAAVKRSSPDSRRRAIRLAKRDDIDDRRFVKKI